jgi:hypothetical protein
MRKFLWVFLLLMALPARAELPGYSLQVLCFADEDVCKMVLGQMLGAMMLGLNVGAESAGNEFLEVTKADAPVDAIEGFKHKMVGDGVYSALEINNAACAAVILPAEMVARVNALDNDMVRESGVSASILVLSLVREINRERCQLLSS